jgi:hypothetical protein
MRKVKVYSTAFGLKAINSSATTWGELTNDLDANNITYSGMNAVENVNNSTLVLSEARLPEGEFVLMLTPQKTKSGSDYKIVRAKVVEIITKYGVPAKEHFNQGGRNYTNKSTAELLGLISLWIENTSATPVVKVEKVVTPKVELTTPASKPVVEKMSFIQALRHVLTYDEISDYEDLEISILDTIEDLENDNISLNVEDLSNEELSWINKMKNM